MMNLELFNVGQLLLGFWGFCVLGFVSAVVYTIVSFVIHTIKEMRYEKIR
jgi:hypothetical protein